jgi:MFS family permease
MGISTGMLDAAMNAQAIMVEKEYKRSLMTSFHAFFSIGMMLGAGTAALFTNFHIDLLAHFWIILFVALILITWMSRYLILDLPDPNKPDEGPLFRLPTKSLVGVGIIAFCCMIGEGALSDWSVNYMENIAKSSKTLAPIGLSAFATAMTLGRIFGDRVRMALGDRKMIVLGGFLSIIGLSAALVFPVPAITIAGFFVVGFGLSTIVPITYSIAGNSTDIPSGVGIAMVTTVGYAGFLVGPPVIGFLSEWQTLRFALVIVSVLFVLMTWLGLRNIAPK